MQHHKIIAIVLIFTSILTASHAQSTNDIGDRPHIIPRASWGANAEFNEKTGIYWESILQARSNFTAPVRSQESIDSAIKKTQEIEEYLYGNFIDQFTSQETIRVKENGKYQYAWPLKYTNYVDSIIVHHTHSEYDNNIIGMNAIHKYHSLNRQWGDIGYNYVIGYDGEIYEGREGGDYVVGAHSKYNNFGTVGIAIMGNYESVGINTLQYNSLEKLIQYLVKKYGINLNGKRYYHRICNGNKCNTFHLETYLDNTLIGHRDATHTSCPGEKLYEQIQQIRSDNLILSNGLSPILRDGNTISTTTSLDTSSAVIQKVLTLLESYTPEQKQNILNLIDIKKGKTSDSDTLQTLQIVRLAVILSLKS